MDCRVASLLAMTLKRLRTRLRLLAARNAGVLHFVRPRNQRGRGEDRVRAAPAVSQACCIGIGCPRAYRFSGEHTGLPHAMALRLIRDRPGDRLSCHHRSWAALAAFELDASTGASDPNDFAVRKGCARQSHPSVHRISPRVRDDRERPSHRGRRAELCTRFGWRYQRFISDFHKLSA